MIWSFDLWHKGRGFGFTLILWEWFEGLFEDDWLVKIDFDWQVKLFGRTWGTEDTEEEE